VVRRNFFLLFVVAVVFDQSVCGAQAVKQTTSRTEIVLSQLMELQGNERIKRLVEGARKERLLVFYSPDREELTNIRIELFKEIYPGVIQKFETPRVRPDIVIDRLLTEERAGRHQADVVWLQLPQVPVLLREKLLARYLALEDSHLPDDLKAPGGHWRSLGNRLFHIMYNTELGRPSRS